MKYWLVALVFIAVLLTGVAAYHAPRFLVYADNPVKSDAVILFLGADFTARKKEAARLLYEDYSRFLIIPSYRQVISLEKIPFFPAARGQGGFKSYPRFYEKTHLELLYAKKMMDTMGLRSAIMVSSPYHMKRIKMIAGRVFGEQSRLLSFTPTPYENDPIHLREMDRTDWMFVMNEYIKICWFQLYSLFIK
jgi:hypothetical protein